MNQLIKQVQRQTAFSHFPRLTGRQAYPIFHLPFFILLITLSFFLITACPGPPETPDCGSHQIEINGDCECEEGYYWGEDQTKCLMDTTNHNFVWEINTIGNYGSYLNDVSIIDENNIWVVGNIETDSGKYGGAYWNGVSWELKKLKGPGISVPTITANGLWCFSEDNIWFASGSIYRWDGIETSLIWLRDINTDETVEKIWASSEDNIYFVGKKGAIVHYDGSTFTRIESGMNIPIVDVWGGDENDTYFCQFNSTTGHSGILHYNGNQLESLYYFESIVHNSDTLSGAIHTIWIYEDTLYAGYSSGIWKENILEKKGIVTLWTKIFSENIYSNKIIGQSNNDIIIVGNWMKMAHYNGVSWKSYTNILGNVGDYKAIDIKGNLICAVGWTDFPKALIVVGKRVMDL